MVKAVRKPSHKFPDVLQLDQWKCCYQLVVEYNEIVCDQINDSIDLDRIRMYEELEEIHPYKN